VNSAAFSPDGARIVTASNDKTARHLGRRHRQGSHGPTRTRDSVNSAAFSPDGLWIVTRQGTTRARIWNAATGKKSRPCADTAWPCSPLHSAPMGSRIVTASQDWNRAHLGAPQRSKELTVLRGHENYVMSAAFSADRVTRRHGVERQDARIGTPPRASKPLSCPDTRTGCRPPPSAGGSRIVTASLDKTVRIWDVATGNEINLLRGHDDAVLVCVIRCRRNAHHQRIVG